MKVNVAKGVYIVLGVVYVVLGVIYLFNINTTEITGFAVANGFDKPTRGLLGTGFLAFGIFLLFKSRRKRKKGQAALEFLMTYGWAILAAIIVIGVLAYFGVYSPGKFSPEAVVVNPPFYANAWSVVADDGGSSKVSLEVRNNGGERLTIKSIELADPESGGDDVTTCTLTNYVPTGGIAISAGELKTLSVNCGPGALADGKAFKADVIITYTKSGSQLDIKSQGTVATRVAPGPGGAGPGCTDTCSSLGYQCGAQTICGASQDCGTCTGGDVCNVAGQCVPPAGCSVDADCDDGNVCTSDSCDAGSCVVNNLPNGPQTGCNDEAGLQCVSGSCTNVISATLVNHWKFEFLSADNTLDDSVGIDDGACSAGTCPTIVASGKMKLGNAANFDGLNDQVAVGPNAANEITRFSMTFWFKTNKIRSRIIARRTSSLPSGTQYDVYIDPNGHFAFFDKSIGAPHIISSPSVIDNNWHFGAVVISESGAGSRIYLDGSTNYATFDAVLAPAIPGSTIIGVALGNYMQGSIDEVRVYDGVLTAADVQRIYDYENTP